MNLEQTRATQCYLSGLMYFQKNVLMFEIWSEKKVA